MSNEPEIEIEDECGDSLEDLLALITVYGPGEWENDLGEQLEDWYAVADEAGIIAYFINEKDAFRFRLDLINIRLNT